MKYCLNPDFRRDAPKNDPFCVRCQRKISTVATNYVIVRVDWKTLEVELVKENPDVPIIEGWPKIEIMGLDCWHQITNDK